MLSPVQNWWDLSNSHEPAYGWWLLTFVIFLGVLIKLLRKPLGVYLEARAADIETAISEAKKAKEEAQARMAEYDAKVAALDAEVATLKAEMTLRGQNEKVAFEKAAKHMAAQIAKEAEESLVAELRQALHTLKSDMASAVIAQAQAHIEATKDAAAQASLKQVFNKGVSEVQN